MRPAKAALVIAAVVLAATAFWAFPQRNTQSPVERPGPAAVTPQYGYRILNVYPHDPAAFTEGLEYRDGFLYESTGLSGHSSLRKVDVTTGAIVQSIALNAEYFGEGITVLNGRIVQLTYQTQLGFIYGQATLGLTSTFSYPGQGWGMANDGKQIYMSDGTDQIRLWNPATLAESGRISVHDGEEAIPNVNELEFVRGQLYANIWQKDQVAIISPADGRVEGWIDLSGLLTEAERSRTDVLNGIAYDAAGQRLFVTGKFWPKLFQIQLTRKPVAGRRHV